jgi:hypothetical protein
MSKVEIKNIKIEEKNYRDKPNAALKKMLDVMKSYDIANAQELLPRITWHEMSFEIIGYTALANAIRRTLVAEIPVYCISVDRENVETDDAYLIVDLLQKNIKMLPIEQSITDKDADKISISLNFHNSTNRFTQVMAEHLVIKQDGKEINIIPEPRFPLIALSSEKYLKIRDARLIRGILDEGADGFTLLDNITYENLDLVPFDIETGVGQRSTESNGKHYKIGYRTKGNIEPLQVMRLCCETIKKQLMYLREMVIKYRQYVNEEKNAKYYTNPPLEVERGDYFTYKIEGFYYTIANLVAQKIYLMDPNILFCAPSVRNLETKQMILRLKHAEADSIFFDSIEECITDIDKVSKFF